jgi:hypothetical protein
VRQAAFGVPPGPGDGREALISLADLGISRAERDGHVNDPDPCAAGSIDGGSHPGQVVPVAGDALDNALLHIHDKHGG